MASKIRLYVDHPLAPEQTVPLAPDQAHYLFGVMRLAEGGQLAVFNGRDGEFEAEIVEASRKRGTLRVVARIRPLEPPPDLWLLFAPVKKARTDFIVEKAVEMGAARIVPVLTEFTNAERVRTDRLRAHVIEAAEQCGATHLADLSEPQRLAATLDNWPEGRRLLFCDEALAGQEAGFGALPRGPWAVLIGPEGGFSAGERDRLRALPYAHPLALGPRILRSDTAAIAALALWQFHLGDWR